LGPKARSSSSAPDRGWKIIRLHELMQIDRFELHVSHADHAKTMRSIELFGTEVAPLVCEELSARSPA
jgi:hypothetical protein